MVKKQTKRPKIDSVQKNREIVQAAHVRVLPPSHIEMDMRDMIFFDNVISEFARAEWTEHTKELAALLARALNDMETDQRMMRTEGSISHTERGTPVINPRKTAVQMNASIIMSIRRSLSLHARAQNGEARDVGKRKAIAKKIESDVAAMDDDGLIARPTVN